jgi:predicted exporter
MSSRARLLALWIVCMAFSAIVVARAHYITDLSAFLPAHPTPAQQLLVDQLRDGPASRSILIAIEGGDAGARARVSRDMSRHLRLDREFSNVNNGEPTTAERDRDFLLQHRYLLSGQVNALRFSEAGLHSAIQDTIDDLASNAGLLMKSLLPSDPTGEMLHIIDQLARSPAPTTRDGVWVSSDGSRAVAVAQTAAAGSDTDSQQLAIRAIRAAFVAASEKAPAASAGPVLRLTVSGPGVFAVAARAKIKTAAVRLSIISSLLVVALLFAVYRSFSALVLGLLPVASGALVGIASVALGFGAVHGITLGFGITLIGEAVDYSIYFFVQSARRSDQQGPLNWQAQWWPTIRLGMLTSVCGFASLLPSGFPGLAQLGLYSISGLITAALVTRHVLPALLPSRFAIRDVAAFGTRLIELLAPVRDINRPVIAACAIALAASAITILHVHRDRLWNRELSALSPVSLADENFDVSLRGDLGAADVRDVVVVSGATLDSVLGGAERASQVLQPLVAAGAIGGFDTPADYLPSAATQQARRGSLPITLQLQANLSRAIADLPIRSESLLPFVEQVEAARLAPLMTVQDLQGTSLGAGFEALVLHQKNRWNALLPLHPSKSNQDVDTDRLNADLSAAKLPQTQVLDLKRESDALYASYLNEAIHLSSLGLLGLVVLLLIALRSPARVVRVLAPLLLSVLVVAAGLALGKIELTILHLVGMLLIVAVGSNYALFFDRQSRQLESDSEALTLASLLIANASTVIGFGLLSFSQVPVLVALGCTVAPGAFLALLFAALMSRSQASRA